MLRNILKILQVILIFMTNFSNCSEEWIRNVRQKTENVSSSKKITRPKKRLKSSEYNNFVIMFEAQTPQEKEKLNELFKNIGLNLPFKYITYYYSKTYCITDQNISYPREFHSLHTALKAYDPNYNFKNFLSKRILTIPVNLGTHKIEEIQTWFDTSHNPILKVKPGKIYIFRPKINSQCDPNNDNVDYIQSYLEKNQFCIQEIDLKEQQRKTQEQQRKIQKQIFEIGTQIPNDVAKIISEYVI